MADSGPVKNVSTPISASSEPTSNTILPDQSSATSLLTSQAPVSTHNNPHTVGKHGETTSAAGKSSGQQAAPVPHRSPVLRFPVRIGITWQKGERIEAQDSNTWYPSKIVDINEAEMSVLVHFEGWNQRYDGWLPMTSERLRPVTRHSGRKDKGAPKRRRIFCNPVYRPGDKVLARWKDCKKYPAKISRMVEEDVYEVNFYDGVTQLVQANNIQPMTEEMENMIKQMPPVAKPSSSFKNVKLNLPASVRAKQDKLQAMKGQMSPGKSVKKKKKYSPSKIIGKTKLSPKVNLQRDRHLDVYSVVGNKTTPVKKVNKEPSQVTITCEATVSTLSEAECLQLFGTSALASSGGSGDATQSSVPPSSSFPVASVGPTTSTAVSTGGGNIAAPAPGTPAYDVKSFAVSGASFSSKGKKTTTPGVRKRAYTDTNLEGPGPGRPKGKRKRPSGSSVDEDQPKKKSTPQLAATERSKSLDTGTPPTPRVFRPYRYELFYPTKAFVVEEDHNPYKCPYEGCTKDFRKESLLQSHIKYYHPDDPPPPTSSPGLAEILPPSCGATGHVTPVVPSPLVATTTAVSSVASASSTLVQSSTVTPSSASSTSTAAATQGLAPTAEKTVAAGKVDLTISNSHTTAVAPPPISAPTLVPSVTPVAAPSKRRRGKTDSICSTDSEMSLSSKSKSSKRQRNDSEISVTTESPEVAGKEAQTDSVRLVQDLLSKQQQEEEELAYPDTEEADEEEMASDVVSCVCGIRQTAGLMIQCEVCLCWQHFKCAGVGKTEAPPANYVCSICVNPKGVRDSCKFLHDFGWERRGELPAFPFKQQGVAGSNPSDLTTLATECNDLLASLHGIKQVLHSTRRQIKLSKEEDDPEFQLWQTDWDNWVKPEDDTVAMTPKSVDLEDNNASSPTSANFMFPSKMSETNGTVPTSGVFSEGKEFRTMPQSSSSTSSSSQLFSLSNTPVKDSAYSRSLSSDSNTDGDHRNATSTSTKSFISETRLPLTIETAQNNTNVPSAIIKSHPLSHCSTSPVSSLSSATTTPPMMLSPELCSNTANTPTPQPPQTPSTVSRVLSRTPASLVGRGGEKEKDSLVKDLFAMGPAGDAPPSVTHPQIPTSTVQPEDNQTTKQDNPGGELSSGNNSATQVDPHQNVVASEPASATVCSSSNSSSMNAISSSNNNTQTLMSPQPHTTNLSNPDALVPPLESDTNSKGDEPYQQKSSNTFVLSSSTPHESSGKTVQITTTQSSSVGEMQKQSVHGLTADGLSDLKTDTSQVNSEVNIVDEAGATLNSIDSRIEFEETNQESQCKNDETNQSSSVTTTINVGTGVNSENLHLKQTEPALRNLDNKELEGTTSRDAPFSSSTLSPNDDHQQLDEDESVKDRNGRPDPWPQYVNGEASNGRTAPICLFNDEDEDTQDNDTDTAEESADLYHNCEHNLLVHIQRTHTDVESQLDALEARIMELENSEHNNLTVHISEENVLNDVPALKKSLSKLARYLSKVQFFSS